MSGPESHMHLGEDLNFSIESFVDFTEEENGAIETAYEKHKGTKFEQVISARGKLFGANTEWQERNDSSLAA